MRKRQVNPLLNLFWFVLFLPVVIILRLLWLQKLPWLESQDQPHQTRQRR